MRFAFVLMLVPLAVAATAMTAPENNDRSVLMANERAWGQAYVTGDVAAIERLLSDDFLGYEVDGSAHDKADAIAYVRTAPHGQSDRVDRFRIRLFGDIAVVQAHEWSVGPRPEKHSKERVFTDVWLKRGDKWHVVASQDTLVQPRKH